MNELGVSKFVGDDVSLGFVSFLAQSAFSTSFFGINVLATLVFQKLKIHYVGFSLSESMC